MKKNYYYILITALFMLCGQFTIAQQATLIFVQDFDIPQNSGAFDVNSPLGINNYGSNEWVINSEYDGQPIYMDTPPQDTIFDTIGNIAFPGGNYMHINDNTTFPQGATYNAANNSDQWTVMNNGGVCTYGYGEVLITFWYLSIGSPYGFGEVYYSTDGGANWNLTVNRDGETKYKDMDRWKYTEISMPQFVGHGNFLIAFRWINTNADTSGGGQIPFAVDDVMLVGINGDTTTPDQPSPAIIATSMSPTPVCHEDVNNPDITFAFTVTEPLCEGDYVIELSDSSCNWDNSFVFGILSNFVATPGNWVATGTGFLVPSSIPIGPCYCYRISRISNPTFVGTPSTICWEIIDCPDSTAIADTPAVLKDPIMNGSGAGTGTTFPTICMNSVIDVPFYSYGAYNPGNAYWLELSDSNGNFPANPPDTIGGPSGPNTQTYDPAIYPPPISPGSQSGKIPDDVPEGCNYYIRVNSTDPVIEGAIWGPFCIVNCDVETNQAQDFSVCVTDTDSVCIEIPYDINKFDPNIVYDPNNEFLFQVLDNQTMAVINEGVLGLELNTASGLMELCFPPFQQYLALPMEPKMYYVRVISSNGSDTTDQWGSLVRMTVTGISGWPITLTGDRDTIICPPNPRNPICLTVSSNWLSPTSQYQFEFSTGGSFTWRPPPGNAPQIPPHPPLPTICFNTDNFPEGWTSVTVQETAGPDCTGPVSNPVQFYIWNAAVTRDFDGDFDVCQGDTVTYTATFFEESNGWYHFEQNGGKVVNDYVPNTQIRVVWDSIGFGFFVSLTIIGDQCAGDQYIQKTVNVLPRTKADISGDTSVCHGETVSLRARNATTQFNNEYNWFYLDDTTTTLADSVDGDTVSILTLTPDTTTDLLLEVIYSPPDGCFDYDTFQLKVHKADVDADSIELCEGDTIPLVGSVNGAVSSVHWEPPTDLLYPDSLQAQTYTVDPITYKLIAEFGTGCSDTAEIAIDIIPTSFDISEDDTIAPGQQSFLVANGGIEYLWEPGSSLDFTDISNPTATPDSTTEYQVKIVDANGCKRTLDVTVFVLDPNIVVPTAFSPNGDKTNDIFYPIYMAIEELYEFKVFNRWGELVFETNVIGQGWDGKYKGVPQEIGTYMFIIKAKTLLDEERAFEGNVTLIR